LKSARTVFSLLRYFLLLAIPFSWCLCGHFGHLQFLENRLLDLQYRQRGEISTPLKIAYVDIDNEAIQAYRWPWNHSRFAQLLDALFDHGHVKAVAFDILFSDNARPDFGIKEQDEGRMLFGKSVHRHQNVVLAANYVPGPGLLQAKRQFPWVFEGATDPDKNDTPELPAFPILGPSWGIAGLIDTYEGEARLAPVFADSPVGSFYPMSLRLALIHWGLTEKALVRFPDRMEVRKPDGTLLTSFPLQRGQLVEANWFSRWISPENPRCSVADIGRNLSLLEDPDPEKQAIGRSFFDQFKDAIVLVGAVDPLLQDLAKTPFDDVPVPQVGFHGNLLKTFVSGTYPRRLPEWAYHVLTFLLSFSVVGLAMMQRLNDFRFKILTLLPVALYLGIAFWIFPSHHVVMPLTAPLGATAMTGLALLGWQLMEEQRAKSRIKNLFGTYVSPELVEHMVKTGESPQLGGVEGQITAYFSDIQDFSEISELLPPEKLVELMNEYLTACTDIVLSQGGALDKYIGDAVLAMFGGLVPLEDHAYRACVTSQLVQLRVAELREKWQREGAKWPPHVGRMQSRIGLNSGLAIIGNMGSPARFNYTMMGDNVNLAARMESGAKSYGVLTMVTEATYLDCLKYGGDEVVFRNLDKIIVKGRSEAVSIFEIVGLKDHVPDKTRECIALYADGLARHQAMDWDGAESYFQQSARLEPHQPGGHAGQQCNPSLVMMARCQQLRNYPPAAGWDGVYVMESK
jgi:adenylate cyclase